MVKGILKLYCHKDLRMRKKLDVPGVYGDKLILLPYSMGKLSQEFLTTQPHTTIKYSYLAQRRTKKHSLTTPKHIYKKLQKCQRNSEF
jgi:hypothetical protein